MNLKYSLGVMGCRPYIYWLGTFCFDYILFLIIFLYFLFISQMVSLQCVTENYLTIIPGFLLFGLSMIPL